MNNEKKNIKSAFGERGMFNEATPKMFELAKGLRKRMTDAEKAFMESFKEWNWQPKI